MLYPNFAVYSGEDSRDHQGHIAENDFFVVFSVEGFTPEEIIKFKEEFSLQFQNANISRIEDFDNLISNNIKVKNLPAGLSLCAGFLKKDILFLKTVNAEVYLRRGANFVKLLDDTKSAAGNIQEGDLYIFSTSDFGLDIDEDLEDISRRQDVNKALEKIVQIKRRKVGTAIILTFQNKIIEEEKPKSVLPKIFNLQLGEYKSKFQNVKSKWIYFVGPIIIILGLIGFLNRSPGQVEAKKQEIIAELDQAAEVAPLSIETATGLIAEADKDLKDLKKLTKNRRILDETEKLIAESKKKILKTDEKQPKEFFDLSVEDKQAQGTEIFLDADDLYVLDPRGIIYKVSLAKKSIDKFSTREIRDAKNVAAYEEKIYFLKSDGIYSLTEGKAKKEISKSENWKQVIDLQAYGGNLYALDIQAKNIYKFSPTEEGFSDGGNYLKSNQEINLDQLLRFAIDGAIYISDGSNINKFLDGYRDAFSFYIPEDVEISQIYTNQESDSLYLLDKKQSKIYILSKEGQYQKQIKSSVLNKAQDFVVTGNSAYVFVSPKIYKIDL